MLYVSHFFYFPPSSTTCHSAFYKVLSFLKPTRAVFIFTKIQLTWALPMSCPLQTTFDQYPKRTDRSNYVSTTKHSEHRQLISGRFVQMETLGSRGWSIINFSLQGRSLF